MELSKCKIGIRPTIDGRWGGIREGLEEQTMGMAKAAKALIEANLTYSDGTPVQVVIADSTIGGGREAALCADKFGRENVCGTLSVTPCWCYGSETMDLDPTTVKAVGLGFQRHRTAGRGVSGGGHGGACPEGPAGLLHLWS